MTARLVSARRIPTPRLFTPAAVIAATTVAVLLLLAHPAPAHASEPPLDAGERIVQTALQYEGQHGGQCFPFVRRVVEEALGWPMGFGYHDGYIEGGAVEVSLASARTGDIIQIIDPNDDGPGASYAGLHTAIVIERASDGTFKVIDSNYGWDEMVRVHDGYDPVQSASRYPNLVVRVYRFSLDGPTAAAGEADEGPLQAAEAAFSEGETARVDTSGSCLNLRATPSTSGQIIRCLPNGATVTILSGSTEGSGFRWQQVQAGGDIGWVADTFLAPVDTSAPPPDASSPSAPAGTSRIISGTVPPNGGLALLMWDGGPLSAFTSEVNNQGCGLLSTWATVEGRMIGHIGGAPDFVNRDWLNRFPGDLPRTALLALCARPGSDPIASPPPSSPTTQPDGSSSVVESLPPGTIPGPAGNE